MLLSMKILTFHQSLCHIIIYFEVYQPWFSECYNPNFLGYVGNMRWSNSHQVFTIMLSQKIIIQKLFNKWQLMFISDTGRRKRSILHRCIARWTGVNERGRRWHGALGRGFWVWIPRVSDVEHQAKTKHSSAYFTFP